MLVCGPSTKKILLSFVEYSMFAMPVKCLWGKQVASKYVFSDMATVISLPSSSQILFWIVLILKIYLYKCLKNVVQPQLAPVLISCCWHTNKKS